MEAMVEATVELLHEQPPDALTIREIAARSGHHHRFVAAWFGGKVGLFRAAYARMATDVAGSVVLQAPPPGTGPSPTVARLLHLMSWLATHDPESLRHDRPTPLIDSVSEAYRSQFGLSPELARLSAQRLIGYFVLTVLFPGPLGMRAEDFDGHLHLEAQIVVALANGEAT
jgi:AcrR family transcriptional regulator